MSAGMTYSHLYAEEDFDDYYEPDGIFENNLHGQAVESFQTGSFYRTANQPLLRSGHSGSFRPINSLYEHYGYALPDPEQSGQWFRPSQRHTSVEAVYSYGADEPYTPPGAHNPFKEQLRRVGDDLFHDRRKAGAILMLIILVLLILALIGWHNNVGRAEDGGEIYNFKATGAASPSTPVSAPNGKASGQPPAALPGSHALMGAPTITVAKIAEVLKQYNSPASGSAQAIYDLGVKYQIDPAYALAFFVHESSAGTKGIAVATRSLGNIRQTVNSGFEGYNGFRKYPSWEVGAEDWYKLIKNLYIGGWNLTTVEQIIPKYAPSEDNNNPAQYINAVNGMVDTWRSGK